MQQIHNADDLIKSMDCYLTHVTDQSWAYAQCVGWDNFYPLFAQDIGEPLTKESIRKTYEVVVQKLYAKLQAHLSEESNELNPDEAVMLIEGYADFIGVVVLTKNKEPTFKLGLFY